MPFHWFDLERHIGNAHHLASERIDDLLIEQVTDDAQHVLVRVIGRELFVPEIDAVERNRPHLIITDR